ncbi:MAG: hypothetical protein R2834_16005 [Rhodothermales bacterium]
MDSPETLGIIERFQHRFVRHHAEDIRRLIDESRLEALADAKAIFRKRTFEQLLVHLEGQSPDPNASFPPTRDDAPVRDEARSQQAATELNDLRAQIARNEELLSQTTSDNTL